MCSAFFFSALGIFQLEHDLLSSQTARAKQAESRAGLLGGGVVVAVGSIRQSPSSNAATFLKASAESWRGGGAGQRACLPLMKDNFISSVAVGPPDSHSWRRMKYWGHDRSGTLMTYQSAAVAGLLVYLAAGWVNLDHVESIN